MTSLTVLLLLPLLVSMVLGQEQETKRVDERTQNVEYRYVDERLKNAEYQRAVERSLQRREEFYSRRAEQQRVPVPTPAPPPAPQITPEQMKISEDSARCLTGRLVPDGGYPLLYVPEVDRECAPKLPELSMKP